MIPVHEQFHSWQGEGVHSGRSACFIRLFGCPVHCPWCDSAGTWHPDYIPKHIERYSADVLADRALGKKPEFVVVTGGEPAIHDLRPLTAALHARGLPVHLETSGAFELKGDFDWVTLSPKRWKPPLAENWQRACEIKVIVDSHEALTEWRAEIELLNKIVPVWLHPEWSQRDNASLLDAITEWVKTHGKPYRAGWQMHKCYRADLRDPGSQPGAPLGGDPERGY
jgi:7-carboxy-7-deazaguanine synthase